MPLHIPWLSLLLATILVAAGPPKERTEAAKAAVSPPPQPPAVAAKPASEPAKKAVSVSDGELERAIRARLAKSKISVDGFTVKVEGGMAILEGHTNIIQHKGTATRLAKNSGAKRVDNRIQISEEARRKAAERLGNHARTKLAVKTKAP